MSAEADLERRVVAYCKTIGLLCWKISSPSNRGVPDRLIMNKNGRVLWLELKAAGKRPTKLQQRVLDDLTARGFHAQWADSFEKAKYYIDELL